MRTFVDRGYVIRFADGVIDPHSYAPNRHAAWAHFCGLGGDYKKRRADWKKTGLRCVAATRTITTEPKRA